MSDPSSRKPFQRGSSINTSFRERAVGKTSTEINALPSHSNPGESNGVQSQSDANSGLESAQSRERIAAYKEERRRQLQSRRLERNNTDSFSSSSDASIRRSLRLKDKAPQATGSISSSSSSTGVRRFITREPQNASGQPWKESTSTETSGLDTTVRSTRASRLRTQMNVHTKIGEDSAKDQAPHRAPADPVQVQSRLLAGSNQSSTDHNENFTERRTPFVKVPPCQRVESVIQSTTESDNSSEPGGAKFKDKSAKRKSNLNRANVVEEVIRPPLLSGHSIERRSRRLQHGKEGSHTSESDKNELAAAKLSESNKRSSSDTQSDSKASNSSVLKRSTSDKQADNRLKNRGSFSKKQSPLKKPEIPEVLKRTSSPALNKRTSPARDSDLPSHLRSSTPKRSSLTDATLTEVEQNRCDFNVSLSSSCCLMSDNDSFHSVSQAPDTELDDTFGTPPETFHCPSPVSKESPVIYTISVSTKGSSYPYEETPQVVEALNIKPFTSFLGGIELSSLQRRDEQTLETVPEVSTHLSSNGECPSVEVTKVPVPILKCKTEEIRKEDIQGILKVRSKDETQEEQQRKPPSILKKRDSSEEKEFESTLLNPILRQFMDDFPGPAHSILKTKSLDENATQPKPILKRGSLSEDHNSESTFHRSAEVPRPILKKKTAEEDSVSEEKPRPILKSRLSHEDMTESMTSAFESDSGLLQSILRKPAFEKDSTVDHRKVVRRNSDVTSDSTASLFRATNFGVRKNSGDMSSSGTVIPAPILKKTTEDLQVPSAKDKEQTDVSSTSCSVTKADIDLLPLIRRGGGLRVSDGIMPSTRERCDRRNTPRYRTQPITQVEVQETDSLESVQAFRTLITTKASLNVFEEEEVESDECQKEDAFKKEYPQRYRPERRKDRRTNSRYKTLPITLETPLEETTTVSSPAKGNTSSSSDEMSGLSVMEKASLFHQKALESVGLGRRSSEAGSKYTSRRFQARSQTQPITEEEVHEAAKMVDGIKKDKKKEKANGEKSDENDPSKLSLMEKMSLFNQKIQEEKPKVVIEKGPRRRRSLQSRFQTQPITTEEVRKANRHSFGGLALSLLPPEDDDDQALEPSLAASQSLLRSTVLREAEKRRSPPDRMSPTGRTRTDSCPAGDPSAVTARGRALQQEPVRRRADSDLTPAPTTPAPDSGSTSSESEEEDDGVDRKKVLAEGQSHLVISSPGQVAPARKLIANPGVLRKLNANLRKKEEKRLQQDTSAGKVLQQGQSTGASTQESPSALQNREAGDSPGDARLLIKRSQTQPMPPKSGSDSTPPVEGGSIKQRLAALQRSGTEDWQKRLFQSPEKTAKNVTPKSSLRAPVPEPEVTPSEENETSAIASRLKKLQKSSEKWRDRIEEKDASQFTVAGKMAADSGTRVGTSNGTDAASPSMTRKSKKIPMPFKDSQTESLHSDKKEVPFPLGLTKSKSVPIALGSVKNEQSSSEDDTVKGRQILVPKADNETFSSFFASSQFFRSPSAVLNDDIPQLTTESFDHIATTTQQLTVQHRKVQVQKRHHAGARNPIRALASRTEFQKQEYAEVASTGVAQKELQRIQVEKLAKTSDKSLSALAGLASAEDFKNVSLRKGGENSSALLPSHKLMLVQVKGRRHVQTRLIEPCAASLNQGDSFLLVTPTKVFCWIGKYTNVIERSKVLEVASIVHLKKDLCFRGSCPPAIMDFGKQSGSSEDKKTVTPPTCTAKDVKAFYNLLGDEKMTESSVAEADLPEEDEQYESSIIDTNMVYMLEGDSLVPNKENWGIPPKIEALQTDKVLVFDFGSEMYVWKGKQSLQEHRNLGTKLAKQLWEKGYDYTECHINPIHPRSTKKTPEKGDPKQQDKGKSETSAKGASLANHQSTVAMSSTVRPNWCIFASINQHMEPVLFREKFLDWPDSSRLIKVKGQEDDTESTAKAIEELKPCDAGEMFWRPCPDADLILETQNVGRGVEWQDTLERRYYEITTLEVTVWHILEYESRRLPYPNGQLHAGDTYVVRWRYMVTQKGRSLQGDVSRHSFTGRKRCAYFFWQGTHSSITEKGTSALMTVELDVERGPHVHVNQGKEPPCFLNLFEGRMVIYKGEREDESTNTPGPWKLFVVRGIFENEVFLLEVEAKASSLRSRTSFLLVNCTTGLIHIWHGCHTSSKMQQVAKKAAQNIVDAPPEEMVFESGAILKTIEVIHGSEPKIFMEVLSQSNADWLHTAPIMSTEGETARSRLFHLNSVSGTFLAHEILCSFRSSDSPCLLPFLQEELYSVSQPALFLLQPSRGHCLYLWQGWWPEGNEETTNVATGSATIRWVNDRRCAMLTALDYAKAMNSDSPPKVFLVSAGLEPRAFSDLFPDWHTDDNISQLNLLEGRTIGECVDVNKVLAQITRTHYSLEELQELPEGVDPKNLEKYLNETDFEKLMKMTKDEFYKLPKWKQTKLKKEAHLF